MVSRLRKIMSGALLCYCAAMFMLARFPAGTLGWAEVFVMVISIIAAVGLVAHLLPSIYLPGEEYAYLVTGWAGFTAMLLYLIDTNDGSARRTTIIMFLLSGVIAGYGSYLGQREREQDG